MLTVRAHPRASAASIGPWSDGVLHVRVTRPPADGEANAAIRRAVAAALQVAPSRLRLLSGERGRTKRFAIEGLEAADLEARLAAIGSGD